MIHYLVPSSQAFGMAEYLDFWGEALAPRARIVAYENAVAMTALPAGTWILAAIDQLGADGLRWLEQVETRLQTSGRARLLNSARHTCTRLALLHRLHECGSNPFRALRATDAAIHDLRFPVFVREEHAHGGALTRLLPDSRALDRTLRRMAWAGWHRDRLLVVEFHDTRDVNGFYRKYAAFIVGDRIVPRSLAHGPHWMLKHSSGEFTRDAIEEERAYVEENPHADALREVARIAGVGWGRVDYALDRGVPVVWEINLNPTIGRGRRPPSGSVPEELRPLRDVTRARFYADFLAALEAIDLDAPGTIDVSPWGKSDRDVLRPPRSPAPLWVRLGRPLRSMISRESR